MIFVHGADTYDGDGENRDDVNASFRDHGEFGISTKGRWISLQWATLSEVRPDGTQVVNESLTKHPQGWSKPEVSDVVDEDNKPTGDRFPGVNSSQQLDNGAWFNVTAWIIDSDSNVTDNKRNSVKFTVYISGWNFASTANSLVLTAGLGGFGGLERREIRHVVRGDLDAANFSAGFLNSPTQASYDGVLGNVTVTHSDKGEPTISWTFHSFTTNLVYDPVIGQNGSQSLAPSVFILFALIFLSLFR